jgi:Ca2+-binding EF-hand superfamily protein
MNCRAITLCLLAILSGCDSRSNDVATNPPAPTTSPPSAIKVEQETPAELMGETPAETTGEPQTQTDPAIASEAAESAAAVAEPEGPADETGPETVVDGNSPALVQETEVIESAVETAYRLWLPTTAGPLLVGVNVLIGEQPLQAAFESQIQEVIEQASDGEALTWERLFEHVASQTEFFGQTSSQINASQHRDLIQRYDRNRNKRPDTDEVTRFLLRDSAFTTEFRLVGTDAFREINRTNSAAFASLDTNRDGKLDSPEIDNASHSLSLLDQNADQRIDFSEISVDAIDETQVWNKRRAAQWGEVATDLSGYVDWSMFAYVLDEMPPAGPFTIAPNAVFRLRDENEGTINRETAKGLLQVQPDLQVEVRFPAVADGTANVSVLWMSAEMKSEVHVLSAAVTNRVDLQGPSLRVSFQATDLFRSANPIPPQAFLMLDANSDGGLDATEIPEQALQEYSFEDFDQDQDGKLTLQEINEGMSPKTSFWSRQVRGRAAEVPDAVLARLDQNHDRFLSAREIIGAPALLKSVVSENGELHPHQLPDTYLVQFGRSEPNQEQELFRLDNNRNLNAPLVSDPMPAWATAMDANQDGEISELEFPGADQQFRQLDRNNDGFIDRDELR